MTWYYGINQQQEDWQTAISTSSSTGKEVEIVVDNTKVTTKFALLKSLDALRDEIVSGVWPLA